MTWYQSAQSAAATSRAPTQSRGTSAVATFLSGEASKRLITGLNCTPFNELTSSSKALDKLLDAPLHLQLKTRSMSLHVGSVLKYGSGKPGLRATCVQRIHLGSVYAHSMQVLEIEGAHRVLSRHPYTIAVLEQRATSPPSHQHFPVELTSLCLCSPPGRPFISANRIMTSYGVT